MLKPELREEQIGTIEVRNTFKIPKIGTIAGCQVISGKVRRNADVRLIRDGVEIFKGKISSLKRFKDDAREVEEGFECGIGLEGFHDIKVGDTIEVVRDPGADPAGDLVAGYPGGLQPKHVAHLAHRDPLCWHRPLPWQKPKERTLSGPAETPL